MIRGLFITGTDTGVGKTVVAAALMHRYRDALKLRYWKPIQTGFSEDDDTATVGILGECVHEEILDHGVRLKRALSPHLAAALSGKQIKLQSLYETLVGYRGPRVSWIVEGAGGVLVPINETETVVDLARMLGFPVLIVARAELGTINHTLLTVEALRKRALIVAGVVMVGEQNQANREAIESHGVVSVLGEMPRLAELTGAQIKSWAVAEFDQGYVLRDHLQLAHQLRPPSR
jgi:dethiobiotin synthase